MTTTSTTLSVASPTGARPVPRTKSNLDYFRAIYLFKEDKDCCHHFVQKRGGKDNNYYYTLKSTLKREQVLVKNAINEVFCLRKLQNHRFSINLSHAFQTSNGVHIVYDYYEKGTFLDYFITQRKTLDELEFKQCFVQLASAVNYMQRVGIFYRDMKLKNILIDLDGNPRFSNFEMAHIFEPADAKRLTGTYGAVGYLAPEILEMKPYSFSLSYWELGVLMMYMLDPELFAPKYVPNRLKFSSYILKKAKAMRPEYKHLGEFLCGLLDADPEKRWCTGPHNFDALKNHPYFRESPITWERFETAVNGPFGRRRWKVPRKYTKTDLEKFNESSDYTYLGYFEPYNFTNVS